MLALNNQKISYKIIIIVKGYRCVIIYARTRLKVPIKNSMIYSHHWSDVRTIEKKDKISTGAGINFIQTFYVEKKGLIVGF